MILKNYACRCMVAVCAFVLVACVDDTYRLDEVSTEVTLAGGTTTLPLGKLSPKTIGDLIGDMEVEGLECDSEGNYSFSYSGSGQTIEFDGVADGFTVPGSENRFEVQYPSFNFSMEGVVIDAEDDVVINNDVLADKLPVTAGALPSYLVSSIPNIEGAFEKSFSGEDMHLLFDLPEQVDNIRMITFKDIESGHHGAPMHLTVDFNGLAGINGGGSVNFDIELSGGIFRIVDEDNNVVEGTEYKKDYTVEPGAEKLDFVIYVESIENTASLNDKHQLDIPLELSCNMTFDLAVKAGDFDLDDKPHFSLYADFQYGDAEIVMNNDVSLVEYHPEEPQTIKIANLPSELKSVNVIELAEDTMLNFYAHGLEWLGDTADMVAVEVVLPEYLVLNAVNGAGYEYDKLTHTLSTTMADISDGVQLAIERLDFGSEGLSPDADGVIALDLSFDINAHFTGSEGIKVSSLIHDKDLVITTGIEEIELHVKSVSGRVDYTYSYEQDFAINMGDFNIGDLYVEGIGLSPVIAIELLNTLTLPLNVEGVLKDDTTRELKLGDIEIKPAVYEGGVVVPTKTTLIIALEERREEFVGQDVVFVAVDFDELLEGSIPSMLSVKLDVGVDSSKVQTLYMAEKFEIKYDYSISLPIALSDKLGVRYSDEFGGLNSVFSQVAEYDVKVGDVTFIAEIENTTPLAFAAEVALIDADGEPVDLDITFEEGYDRINGSKDGVTPAKTTLRINVGGGAGISVVELAKVDGVIFTLVAESDADGSVAINKNQSVSATLALELSGGITVDVKDFINK